MKLLLGSFWRAVAYCLHPKVIALSLLPLLVAGAATLGAGFLFWESAIASVRASLEHWSTRCWSGCRRCSARAFAPASRR
jgi:hypothetical protein